MNTDKFKIYQGVFDNHTFKVLYKLSERYFDKLHGTISEGKEANVFLASKGDKRIAVKIFRFDTTNFTRIKEYIVSDPRFPSISSKHRELVFLWCRKEYQNLLRAYEAGLHVPKPIDYKKNVILMEFIGKNEATFPTADKKPPENPQEWYEKLSVFYRKLAKVKMIHADFSKYNIINADGEPVVIDWAQAVLTKHNYALKYLKRDIENFNKWFKSLGAKVNEELFNELKSEMYV